MTNNNFNQNHLVVDHSGEIIADKIPTTTIKKAEIQATVDADTLRSSYTPGAGSFGLLTYLHLSTNIEKTTYALTDRDGTFDIFQMGTAIKFGNGTGKTDVVQIGNWKEPLHVIKGTFGVYNVTGSYAGSFTIAWELTKI